MADALSIAPVVRNVPAGIPPLALTLPADGRGVSTGGATTSPASIVDLSASGQLLSAVFTFRSTLEAVPASGVDGAPGDLASAAQRLVDAITALQNSGAGAPAESANLLAELLSPDLDVLATASADTAGSLFALQDFGIDLLTGTTTPSIDPLLLGEAIATDPVATQTALLSATQTLIAQADALETGVLSALLPPAAASLPTATPPAAAAPPAVAPALPEGVPADDSAIGTAINPPPLAPTPTPLPPVSAAPPPAAAEAIGLLAADDGSAAAFTLPATDIPPAAVVAIGPPAASPAEPLAATSPAPVATAAAATPPPPVAPAVAAPLTPAAAAPPLAVDVVAAERRAAAATQTLQTLLADPRLRALDNQADPAYAAVIAATHLSDFDTPRPFTNPKALATDSIGPVSALVRARAIADYREVAGEAGQRTRIGTDTTRQYWV